MRDQLPAIQKCEDLLKDLLPRVEKFPRGYKFTIGERIVSSALELLELLVESVYSRDKAALLHRANIRVETLRHLLRLSRELGPLPNRGYEHVMELLSELGRQIGGWRRHVGRRDGQNVQEPVP
jgi:hypothetical protein